MGDQQKRVWLTGPERDELRKTRSGRIAIWAVEALVREDGELSNAVTAERERCNAIVQAARVGKIDQDFRCISHWIMKGRDPMETKI